MPTMTLAVASDLPLREAASSNNALDPTAVSVSDFMRFDFTESFSYRDRAVPAVGQLGRSAIYARNVLQP